MALRNCQLDELQPRPEDSSVTASGHRYDVNLHLSMQTFWEQFSSGIVKQTNTCQICSNVTTKNQAFTERLLYFPQSHLIPTEITWTLDELLIYNRSGQSDKDYHCIHCNRRTVVTRYKEITVFPKLLLIVLCRRMAEENTDNINIVNTAVEFTLEDFCFSTISNVQEKSSVDLS